MRCSAVLSVALAAAASGADDTLSRAVDAYSFLFPLMLAEQTRKGEPTPSNVITNIPIFPPPFEHSVVRPNEDTLYSIGWLDLSSGPLVLSVPDTGGRYYVLQMMSLWTDTFAAPGKRTTGTNAQKFAIVGPRFKGKLPAEFAPPDRHFLSPTEAVWLIGRTQTNGTSDYNAVHQIQHGYKLEKLEGNGLIEVDGTSMEEQQNRVYTPDTVFAPPDVVEAMDAEQFFTNAAELMISNPPTKDDVPFIADVLTPLGIPAGDKPLDWHSLDASVQAALNKSVPTALAQIKANSTNITGAVSINGWSYPPPQVGACGTDYALRSSVALFGLGANKQSDAIYVSTDTLPAGSQWKLEFAKGTLPPVNAFWSLSAYDTAGYFVKNKLSKYAIHNFDSLQFEADGSLVLYFGDKQPEKAPQSNWLPAPSGAEFVLTTRIYWPQKSAIDRTWVMPALTARAV